MCCRRRSREKQSCKKACGAAVAKEIPIVSKGKDSHRPEPLPTVMAIRPRNNPAPQPGRMSHDDRLDQINNEVLHNADVAPPSYDEIVVNRAEVASPRPIATAGPASTSNKAGASHYPADSKLARDLQYYNDNRGASAASPVQTSSQSQPPPRNISNNEKHHGEEEFYSSDLSDDDSWDSDAWENETISGDRGIHTPGSTVNGDRPLQQTRSAPVPTHLHQQQDKSRGILLRHDSSTSALDRIRERHNLPHRTFSNREDYRAAKEAYKAEKREAKAAYRAAKESRREAFRRERDELRDLKHHLREQRRTLKRGC